MHKLGAMHVTNITGAKHTATVIFFHGSGSTGESVKEWVSMLTRKPFEFPHVKVLYPTAPLQPYTPSGGHLSNVWFDRSQISPQAKDNSESLEKIATLIKELIKEENDLGVPNNRIIVGGFSMGGGLALNLGYRWIKDLAGVFAFSSFLSDKSGVYDHLAKEKSDQLPPLLQLHGEKDDLVWTQWGKNTFDTLTKYGVKGEFHELPKLDHSLDIKGIGMIKDWIEKTLPETLKDENVK